MFRDALLIAGKDLRLELRSKVVMNQVLPFAVMVLLLFAFALDPDREVLATVTAGLFWVAVLFSSVLAIQRSFALESADGNRDALRMSGLDPAGIFLGKGAAIIAQLFLLEVVLALGVALFYGTRLTSIGVLAIVAIVATIGVVAAGCIYGVLAAGLRVRDTLLPLLLLPVLAPVLIAATQATEAALRSDTAEAWPWVGLLGVFAIIYLAAGLLTFGLLLEET